MTEPLPAAREAGGRPAGAAGWARWWPVIVAGAVTAGIELAVFAAAGRAGASQRDAILATLAASVVWVALAGPALAAGPERGIDGLFRGGVVADASAVALLALWLMTGPVTILAAVKIYCILGAMALAAVSIVRCGRSAAGRAGLAVATAVVFMAALASPFWANGLMTAYRGTTQESIVGWCVRMNPMSSIAAAAPKELAFVWHTESVMYNVTVLGEDVPTVQVHWYAAVVIYLIVAGIALGVNLLRKPAAIPEPAVPPTAP